MECFYPCLPQPARRGRKKPPGSGARALLIPFHPRLEWPSGHGAPGQRRLRHQSAWSAAPGLSLRHLAAHHGLLCDEIREVRGFSGARGKPQRHAVPAYHERRRHAARRALPGPVASRPGNAQRLHSRRQSPRVEGRHLPRSGHRELGPGRGDRGQRHHRASRAAARAGARRRDHHCGGGAPRRNLPLDGERPREPAAVAGAFRERATRARRERGRLAPRNPADSFLARPGAAGVVLGLLRCHRRAAHRRGTPARRERRALERVSSRSRSTRFIRSSPP